MAKRLSQLQSALASTVVVERSISFGDKIGTFEVEAEYLDKTRGDVEDFAEACMKPGPISLALQASALAFADNDLPPEHCVYVIGAKDAKFCKIGYSRGNPLARLQSIQVGNWHTLYVHALFWFIEGSAMGAEQLSHRVARKMGNHVQGEWFAADPQSAAYIVASVVHSANVKVADSGMWLRQREAMRKHRARAYNGATMGSRYTSIGATLDLSELKP